MPQVIVSRPDLENLAKKLDELAPSLDDQERAVLLAVFGMASQRFETIMADQGASGITGETDINVNLPDQGTPPPLSTGFMDTFSPAGPATFSPEGKVTVSVTVEF